jgi:hypothetical protein
MNLDYDRKRTAIVETLASEISEGRWHVRDASNGFWHGYGDTEDAAVLDWLHNRPGITGRGLTWPGTARRRPQRIGRA